MDLFTIGIDLGKTTFQLVGITHRGDVVVRKEFSRIQLLRFTANLKVELIGMEACGGSHFLGRALREQGHEVRLIPAQYVKPYVKTNKSDYIDAEANRSGRATQDAVCSYQDDLQSLHRVRERWVMRRTAVVNQIRGLLLERGITLRKGRRYVESGLPSILARYDIEAVRRRACVVDRTQAGTGATDGEDRPIRSIDEADRRKERSLSSVA
jgi:transposase